MDEKAYERVFTWRDVSDYVTRIRFVGGRLDGHEVVITDRELLRRGSPETLDELVASLLTPAAGLVIDGESWEVEGQRALPAPGISPSSASGPFLRR